MNVIDRFYKATLHGGIIKPAESVPAITLENFMEQIHLRSTIDIVGIPL